MKIYILIILLISSISLNSSELNDPKIALVLSGGGARGFSQVGVLKILEKYNIEPDYIVGTSIGAIIGASYASGYSANEIDSIIRNTNWDELFSLNSNGNRDKLFRDQKIIEDRNSLRLRFDNFKFEIPQAVSEGAHINIFLQDLFWNARVQSWGDFDNLKYPFRAIATDLVSGESISIKNGELSLAVRASSTVPLRYTPVKIKDMILVDGGVKGNLPVLAAKEFNPDIIIAVNTTSPLLNTDELEAPWELADQVVSILIKENINDNISYADVVVNPDLDGIKNTDFNKGADIISIGEKAAENNIKKILELIYSWNKEHDAFNNDNNRGKIGSIDIIGSSASFISELEYHLNSNFIGKDFDLKNEALIRDKINQYFRDKEYSFLNISDIKKTKGKIEIFINDGLISKIIINDKKGEFLVKRDLTFKEGDNLNGKSLTNSYQNLINNGYFKDVNIELNKDSLNDVIVNIDVNRLPSQNLMLGINANNERNTQLGVELLNNNIFGYGNRASLRFSGGTRDINGRISFENPRIGETFINLSTSFYYSHREIYTYSLDPEETRSNFYRKIINDEQKEQKFGFNLSGGFQLGKLGDLNVIYRFEKQRSYFFGSQVPDFYNLSTIKIESVFDTENDRAFPTSGYFARTFFESNLFSDPIAGFSKWFFNYRINYSIGKSTLTPSIIFGFADRTLPQLELFNFGGQYNFYGLRQFEERGRQVFKTSLNYRIKSPVELLFDTYLSIRYDLGSVWDQPEQIKLSGLRHGIGSGIAIATPLGQAEVSIGRSFFFSEFSNGAVNGPWLLYFYIGTDLGSFSDEIF